MSTGFSRSDLMPVQDSSHAREHAVQRLVAHLITHVGEDGAVRDRCASRVLESVLMLTLLRRTGLHLGQQAALVRYLHNRRTQADALSSVLIDAALNGSGEKSHPPLAWLASFEHFTAPRKHLMFSTILAAAGATPFDPDLDLRLHDYRGLASWAELTMCAVKILHCDGRDEPIEDVDSSFLIGALGRRDPGAVWEGHVLAHLIALLALHRCTHGHPYLVQGVAAVLNLQNADGGIPFIAGFEIFCTATAGLALALAGAPAEQLGRMAGYLTTEQSTDGGWGYAEGVTQTDADDTAYCLQFLRSVTAGQFAEQIDRGERYLVALANLDGGFPTFRHGHTSEIVMTAGAITALAQHARDHTKVISAAVRFLLNAHSTNTSFERSWSLSESNAIYRTLIALDMVAKWQTWPVQEEIHRLNARFSRHLQETQNTDGGWGQRPGDPSDPISSSYALMAIDHWGSTPKVGHRAMAYLLTRQQDDGGLNSIPDQTAPRPIPYDVPVLADIFALLALGSSIAPRGLSNLDLRHR